jgi:hypothetical protein
MSARRLSARAIDRRSLQRRLAELESRAAITVRPCVIAGVFVEPDGRGGAQQCHSDRARLPQEAREPRPCGRVVRDILQFRSHPKDATDHAGDGGWSYVAGKLVIMFLPPGAALTRFAYGALYATIFASPYPRKLSAQKSLCRR